MTSRSSPAPTTRSSGSGCSPGTVSFPEAVQALPPDLWEGRFERTRGGPTLPLRAAPLMRVREIEIHHVDLDVGYSPDAWPPGFAEELVDGMVKRQQPDPDWASSSARSTPTAPGRWAPSATTHSSSPARSPTSAGG